MKSSEKIEESKRKRRERDKKRRERDRERKIQKKSIQDFNEFIIELKKKFHDKLNDKLNDKLKHEFDDLIYTEVYDTSVDIFTCCKDTPDLTCMESMPY